MEKNSSEVRLDKYLWAVRIFKNRTLATEACRNGKIEIGGTPAKPSRQVRINDIIIYKTPPIVRTFKVLDLLEKRQAAKLIEAYIIETTPPEEFEKLKTIKEGSFIHRNRGLGRPTKRDRRRIGQFFDDDN